MKTFQNKAKIIKVSKIIRAILFADWFCGSWPFRFVWMHF